MNRQLPRDSYTVDTACAIARIPGRVERAAAFWCQAFVDLGITDVESSTDKALSLGEKLPHDSFSKLMPERNRLVAYCPQDYLCKQSGCLVSLDEIAMAVHPAFSPEQLRALVAKFLNIGTPGVTASVDEAAWALEGMRELFDAIRRFRMCERNAQEFGLSVSELLALYRQEGALCVAPPTASYPHAPLIHTGADRPCRTELTSNDDPTCRRTGFNLRFRFPCTSALRTDTSIRFDVVLQNLLAIGGLDIIANPTSDRRDELRRLWRMASSGGAPDPSVLSIREVYRNHLSSVPRSPLKAQRLLLDDLCVGLLRSFLEEKASVCAAADLLDRVRLSLRSLFAAHAFDPPRPWPGTNVHLAADMDGSDTYGCLQIQARWHASRKELRTLLAWKDRSAPHATLNPFMTYLRFHVHDVIFVGLLLRCLSRFDYLVKAWTSNKARWGTAFLDAIPSWGLNKEGFANLGKDLQSHWKSLRSELPSLPLTWHHLGAIEALRQVPPASNWLQNAEPPDSRQVRSAAIVGRLVEILERPHVLDVVSAALEYTPAHWLVDRGYATASGDAGKKVFVKTHSFERLRLAYHQAAREAGIE